MKLICITLILFITKQFFGQKAVVDSIKLFKNSPEIFTSGFIDIMNNGQLNASARFIRLNIGEPGKLFIPLSLYGGVSNNTFNGQQSSGFSQKNNDQLVNQYINPLSGIINISVDGIIYLSNKPAMTKTGFIYQAGERILTGYRTGDADDPQVGRPSNFLNNFATGGLYFQTGAWERSSTKNVGIFWLAARYIICYSSRKSIREFLPDIQTNGLYHGYSLGFGVEINNLVNIKRYFTSILKSLK